MNTARHFKTSKTTTLRAEVERDITRARPIRPIEMAMDERDVYACFSRRQQTGRVRRGCRAPVLR
jgi:hypothetical protein